MGVKGRSGSVLGAVVLGGVCGAAIAVILSPHRSDPTPPSAAVTTTETERAAAPTRAPRPLGQTEQARVAPATVRTEEPPAPGQPPEESADPVEMHAQRHRRAIEAHFRDPVDDAWANASAQTLSHELEGMSKAGHFRVGRIDCKSSSCIAVTEWNDFETARTGYADLVHHVYPVNCAREMFLPTPSDPSATFEATLVLSHCEGPTAAAD
jgi:hypothetical protein